MSLVLIVAKCIVNLNGTKREVIMSRVLIVAKCIVNCVIVESGFITNKGINSSKVYCK